MDIIFERYEIATSRIREIINEDTVSEPFKSFFCKASEFICKIDDLNLIKVYLKKFMVKTMKKVSPILSMQ